MSEQLSSNLRKNKILTNKKRVGIGVYIANVFKKKRKKVVEALIQNQTASGCGLYSYSPNAQG